MLVHLIIRKGVVFMISMTTEFSKGCSSYWEAETKITFLVLFGSEVVSWRANV